MDDPCVFEHPRLFNHCAIPISSQTLQKEFCLGLSLRSSKSIYIWNHLNHLQDDISEGNIHYQPLPCKLDARVLSSLFVSSACHAIKAPVFPLDHPTLNISCDRISCESHCLMPRCRTLSRSSCTISLWIFVCKNDTDLASFSPIWKARATCVALSHAWGWNLFSRKVEIKRECVLGKVLNETGGKSWTKPKYSKIVCLSTFLKNIQLPQEIHRIWWSPDACCKRGSCKGTIVSGKYTHLNPEAKRLQETGLGLPKQLLW